MKLILNTPGLYLCKRGECFQIQSENEKREIAATKVDQIMITTHAALTTDAIELALEYNIDIIFLKTRDNQWGVYGIQNLEVSVQLEENNYSSRIARLGFNL